MEEDVSVEEIEPTISFTEMRLSRGTLDALARMGIETPTPIQQRALPALLDGHDVIGQARTGSGKTLAFGIPAIELVDPQAKGVQVLILTPTRELAVQIAGVLEQVGKGRGVSVGLLYGGKAEGPQRMMLKQGVNIIVGTPGRVLDMVNQAALWLNKVRFLVLDEADEMLDRGFAPDVERILARTTDARQTALFSATVPDWVQATAARHLNDPVGVSVDPRPEDAAPIDHIALEIADGNKIAVVRELLDNRGEGSVIVFGRTKHGVKKLARQLEAMGYPVAALQGNLSQNARDDVMEMFRDQRVPILVATNVAARGLDVSHVETVINMELPESPALLTHRIGRTGRMGRQGRALTLLGPEDAAKWRMLEKGLGRRIARARWTDAQTALYGEIPELAAEEPVRQGGGSSGSSSRRGGRGGGKGQPHPGAKVRQQGAAHPHQPVAHHRDEVMQVRDAARQGNPPAQGGSRPAGQQGSRSGGGSRPDNRNAAPRQLYVVECSACGATAKVPFEPRSDRPVYCRDCFMAMRGE